MGNGIHPDVLLAARAGAGWAFERIYAAWAPAVHGYLRAQGAVDAEGMVNDVFLRVYRRIESFEGDATGLRSWVFVIAHNLVLDQRRYAGRRHQEVAVERLPDLDLTGDVADIALGGSRVRALLALVSPEQRDVLLLRFLLDLSLEDTAAATGRTVTAVKALQRRGLDSLRRRLEEIPSTPVSPRPDPTLTEA